MELQFFGAVRTVTGSMHRVEVNGQSILLDCGLFQGRRAESRKRNKNLPFDAKKLHNVVLSHAHIDHAGNLPQLARDGFHGKIFCTRPTRSLSNYMLRDSASIQERDAEYLNRRAKKNGKKNGKKRKSSEDFEEIQPLYTMEDAERILEHFEGYPYETPIHVADGVQATFFDAGHILGSASVLLEIEENGKKFRVGFSGDIGRRDVPILRDPIPLKDLDVLLIESTYGNRLHEPVDDLKEHFAAVVKRTVDRGGKIIIPAFSVGRTQNVALRLPNIPVFVDSPLAANATKVFRSHPEVYDEGAQKFLEDEKDPFGFARLHYTQSVDESIELNTRKDPCIIISASGMCEAGRILHHLKHNVENPKNTVLIVGFQAEHTLGRRLVEEREDVKIYGRIYKRKCEVVTLNGFSGHADRDGLVQWVRHSGKKPKHTFVVHGDEERSLAFKETLESVVGLKNVVVPHLGQKFGIKL